MARDPKQFQTPPKESKNLLLETFGNSIVSFNIERRQTEDLGNTIDFLIYLDPAKVPTIDRVRVLWEAFEGYLEEKGVQFEECMYDITLPQIKMTVTAPQEEALKNIVNQMQATVGRSKALN